MDNYAARLRAHVAGIRQRDGHHYVEAEAHAGAGNESTSASTAVLEAVIRMARPVLDIHNDAPIPIVGSLDQASQAMVDGVMKFAIALAPVIPAVGRIELQNNDRYAWAGTGWLIDSDVGAGIVITNAHVADVFAHRGGAGFTFRPGTVEPSRHQEAHIDFREETGTAPAREFRITDVVYASDRYPLDVAILRAAPVNGGDQLSRPIALDDAVPDSRDLLALIGYPGYDSGAHDAEVLMRLFRGLHEKKRLSPGRIMGSEPLGLAHDCSSLPGSSGSVLVNLRTGGAVGLHFRGRAFEANHAVPAADILRLLRDRPWQGVATRMPSRVPEAIVPTSGIAQLPIEIIVRVGAMDSATRSGGAVARRLELTKAGATEAAQRATAMVRDDGSIRSIRAARLFKEGMITDDYGVVVKVKPEAPRDPAVFGLPRDIDGVPVHVEMANIEDLVRDSYGSSFEAAARERYGYTRDLSDARFSLEPIEESMRLILHVSPERGWPLLRDFLNRDDYDVLTIGMYHMTAPHVVQALEAAIARSTQATLTLDRKSSDDIGSGEKVDDLPEVETLASWDAAFPDQFAWAPASISGHGKLFHSAYHIKVAVLSALEAGRYKDRALWLSSGNWQSTNQGVVDDDVASLTYASVSKLNREWHAIVEECPRLCEVFRNHLAQDYEDNRERAGIEAPVPALPDILVPDSLLAELERPRQFRAFPEKVIEGVVRVTPVLTPDNYGDVVLDLLKQAVQSILFENQSFSLSEEEDGVPDHFLALAKALLKKQQRGLDVRIIFRSGFGKERDTMRRLVEFGFDKKSIRFFDKVHTKGIVVDGEKVLLGSQNWTGAGTGPNRDASLLVEHPGAGAYFASLFEYDWAQMATSRVRDDVEAAAPIRLVSAGTESHGSPPGYVRVSWQEIMGA